MYELDAGFTKKVSRESLWNSRLILAFQDTNYPNTFFVRHYIECLSTNFYEEY